ncbi:hypothetical protein EWE75_01290 [Sphingomonas populi]|uniref:Alpha/beta hydrolase n=1 Tax=Sphingomonas populi TaxID=2484750 RepID=A0A4Q6YAB3_9SPHN|nr:hypothetical protein [Sphingomonas populi]RZF66516.1 hypothetical protein EWE75_01290 [Sphingomonas populi]
MIDHYDWRGGREAMLRFGPETGPIVVIAMPLFEEANRTRAFVVTLCRALAARGVASALPDLPGQGESLVPLETCSIFDVAEGIERASKADWEAGRALYSVAIRSGAILDKLALFSGRWHFAPQTGPELLRDLKRVKQASIGARVLLGDLWYFDVAKPEGVEDQHVEIAGNRISTSLLTALSVYEPWRQDDGGHVRTVRLDTDRKPADRHVPGTPLWRRAEPSNDPALAALLADDIAAWIARCGG